MGEITLVLGGIRSGKSAFAERLAGEAEPPVLYLATGQVCDDEMRLRVEQHRARRPPSWTTIEAPINPIAALDGSGTRWKTVLLDSISSLITNLFFREGQTNEVTTVAAGEAVSNLVEAIVRRSRGANGRTILVSDEVGLSPVALYPSGRRFQDLLGLANQLLASQSDTVILVAAGLPLVLKGIPNIEPVPRHDPDRG
jgi:adenosylcobinamide kinase / adenosylcobinamide-phosphate guanylyltransferase